MNADDEACNIGAAEVCELINVLAYGNELDGRTGCEEIASAVLPKVRNVGGSAELYFEASKSGYSVTINTMGTGVAADLIAGDYFVWSDGLLDQVTAVSETGFTSIISETRALDTGCKLIRQVFGGFYHDKHKRIYFHIGTELYFISSADFSGYTKVPYVGKTSDGLQRSITRFKPSDDDVIMFNDNSLLRIIKDKPFDHFFQVNSDCPSRTIDDVDETGLLTYGRQVSYSMSRIVGGDYNEGRLGTGNNLLQETPPVSPDSITRKDTAKVFTELPVGLGSELNYTLVSEDDSTDHITTNTSVWEGLKATAGFKIKLNSALKTINPDFTGITGAGFTILDIAEAIQIALRNEYPKATCQYHVSDIGNPTLIISPGENGTVDAISAGVYVAAPDELIDLTAYLFMDGTTYGEMVATQAKAPANYSSAKVPDDGAHFTHFTLWGTTNIGSAGIALQNKTEKLVWLKDIPIIRVLSCTVNHENGAVVGDGDQVFHQDDCGSRFRFFDGTESEMTKLYTGLDGTQTWAETSKYGAAVVSGSVDFSGPCAFGANKVSKASQSGKYITLTDDATYIYFFEETDEGKIIFLQDGTLRHISKYMTPYSVEVIEGAAADEFVDFAIAWDYDKKIDGVDTDNRSLVDRTTDKIVTQRGKDDDFLLQTRYYEALPSSAIGEMASNFIFVAPENSTVLYYGAVPLGKKNRLGYHHPGYQKDDKTEDVIMFIKKYADRIVCFCRRTTYGTSLSTINSIDEPDIGEKVFLIPTMSLIDNIGLVHTESLQDIGIGQSIMITHEPAVRAFDGKQFGTTDMSKGVYTYISSIARTAYSSYDPVGGYRIYCTLQETLDVANRINPDTGFCLQLAIDPEQGSGWSIQNGPEMVMPMPMTQGMLIENEKGYLIQAMLDERTGKLFNISTYDGPAGSGLAEVYVDKGDTEIVLSFRIREDKGNPESEQLEFLASHVYLRPNTDAGGTPAYRTGMSVSCRVYNDGAVAYTAQTLNIPIPGDISFDRKSQGPRIQLEYILSTSDVVILGIDRIYAARDRAGNQALSSRSTSELTHQREYANQVMWLSRGRQPLLNRSIGNVAIGAPAAYIEGPDGKTTSAMQFDGEAEPVVTPIYTPLTADMTIQFGFKFPATPETVPIVPETPDGSEWEGMEKIGSDTTYIALNRTKARFDLVVGNVARAFIGAAGWSNSAPADPAEPAILMGVYFDQDRSAWIFWIDGAVVGCVDGNGQTNNFIAALPVSYFPTLISYIDCVNYTGKMVVFTMTNQDDEPHATGYIDATGIHDGAPA
jgi:hypothetical protein